MIFISSIELGFLVAYLLKSSSLKILPTIRTMSKKGIFLFKNMSTKTSFEAFIIVGMELLNFKLLLIKLIEGNFLTLTFSKLKLFNVLVSIFLIFKIFFLLPYKIFDMGIFHI